MPIDSASSGTDLDGWFLHASLSDDPTLWKYYDYRHIATTCSVDRILNPVGPTLNNCKMVNVNAADIDALRRATAQGLLDAGVAPAITWAANFILLGGAGPATPANTRWTSITFKQETYGAVTYWVEQTRSGEAW